ncbi:MAG: CRISPR-associated endonuclease Cas2 [bacterium]|nr:CRISPR-associated endonuclease Cas2 [bacterium]
MRNLQGKSRLNIERIILRTLAVSGMLAIVLLAPNALMLLKQLDKGKKRKKNPKYLITSAVKRLSEKKLINVDDKNGKVSLSPKGQHLLALLGDGNLKHKKQKTWDQKWRMVIFDIPEKRKRSREQLRLLLNQIGFLRLQDSVWVYPYETSEMITLLKIDNFLRQEVLYLVVEQIENDQIIRGYFNL